MPGPHPLRSTASKLKASAHEIDIYARQFPDQRDGLFRRRPLQVSPVRRGREEHRVAPRRAAHVRRRERPLRGRAHTGVAGGVAGGGGAERDQDVGDGAVAQGPAAGLQVGEPGAVHPVRERRPRADWGGDAGRGQLQRAAGRQPAPGARGRLRRRRRDVRVLARPVPRRVPARVRVGGARCLLRPARDHLQVPALGPQGGALQGPRRHRREGRVPRRRRPQGGRAAAGGGRGGVLRPGGAFGWAPQGPQGGFLRGGTRRGGARREVQRGRYHVGVGVGVGCGPATANLPLSQLREAAVISQTEIELSGE